MLVRGSTRAAPYGRTSGTGKGELCPFRGYRDSPPEGWNGTGDKEGIVDNSGDKWTKLEQVVRQVVREELERFVEEHLRPELRDQLSLLSKAPKLSFVNGKWTGITDQQMEIWRAAYPSCDVDLELKKAAGWILANPMKAPKTQLARFMNAWLAKQHLSSSIRSIPTRNDLLQDQKKFCAYCDKPRTGMVGGIAHCSAHAIDAMDGKPVKAA